MTREEMHVGDIGTKIGVIIKEDDAIVDISAATTKEIFLEKPDKTKVTKTAQFETDGTDGKIYFLTLVDSDLDQAGNWKRQGHIITPTGEWRSSVIEFEVNENID